MNKFINGKKIALLIMVMAIFMVTAIISGCQSTNTNSVKKETQVLRIGTVPAEDAEKTREEYKTMGAYLEKKLGVKTEVFVASDYTGVIEAMRAGKVDLVYYGPLSYVLATEKANAEAFAKEYIKGSGSMYEAYIITHPDSGINQISDLKGKSFAFVDPASTGGYIIPRLAMVKNGINPEQDLANMIYAGGHDATAMAVKNKKVDAAAIVKHKYDKMLKEGLFTDKDVKIIHVSDPFPGAAWAWRKDLPEDLKAKVKEAIINIPEEEKPALKKFMGSVVKYDEAKDSDWDSIREAAKLAGIDLNK